MIVVATDKYDFISILPVLLSSKNSVEAGFEFCRRAELQS